MSEPKPTLYVRPCDNPTHMRQGHYGGCYEPVVRCEHGMLDPHIIEQRWWTTECPGSPTLAEADDE